MIKYYKNEINSKISNGVNLLIKNARVIDPQSDTDKELDVLIEKGKIKRISKGIKGIKCKTINAKNKIAVPGLVDMHAHLREPGREDEETLYTGSLAAINGGFTTVVCMANTTPVLDTEQDMDFIYTESKKLNLIDIFPVAAVTKDLKQTELTEIAKLKRKGAVALSDDGEPIVDNSLFRHALEYARMYNLVIISHCEDPVLSSDGVMNEGYMSTILGLKGIPSACESIMVARDINLARLTGSHVHIAHVSCKESVELIRGAKKEGIKITAETCPHYFTLCDEDLKDYDTNFKVNPPLRGRKDVEAIKEAIADDTIDVIATDHAPHLDCEKNLEFDKAPFGMTGLETALGLVFKLVDEKIISIKKVIEKMSVNPANILSLKKGSLEAGAVADITIINPLNTWVVKEEDFKSKSKNSGFIGMQLKAKATEVISSGRLLMQEGKIKQPRTFSIYFN